MRRLIADAAAGERGLTLVEVLVALAVLAIVVIPLTGLLVSNAESAGLARAYLQGTYLAQSRIEELRAAAFNTIVAEPRADVTSAQGFQRQVSVTDLATGTASGMPARLKQVTVTVTWADGAKSVSLSTLISAGHTP